MSRRFRIDSERTAHTEPLIINPTSRPSSLLDVSQWLTLCHTLLDQAANTDQRRTSRTLKYQAGLCLQEALKFYEPDSDLPPPSAMFSPRSRAHVREHPAQFARSRLLELRASLPTLPRRASTGAHRPRRWWELWRR